MFGHKGILCQETELFVSQIQGISFFSPLNASTSKIWIKRKRLVHTKSLGTEGWDGGKEGRGACPFGLTGWASPEMLLGSGLENH